jgi:hypothetical protein
MRQTFGCNGMKDRKTLRSNAAQKQLDAISQKMTKVQGLAHIDL